MAKSSISGRCVALFLRLDPAVELARDREEGLGDPSNFDRDTACRNAAVMAET